MKKIYIGMSSLRVEINELRKLGYFIGILNFSPTNFMFS